MSGAEARRVCHERIVALSSARLPSPNEGICYTLVFGSGLNGHESTINNGERRMGNPILFQLVSPSGWS